MENPQGASFIPKSPVRGSTKPRKVRRVYVLTYVAFVCFIGSLLAAGGMFFYDLSIDRKIDNQKILLSEEQNAFSQSDLEHVRDLENRMNTADAILNKHVSVHAVLTALEKSTLATTQLTELAYSKEPDGSLLLNVYTKIPDFNATLFQREILTGNTILSGAEIIELAYNDITAEEDGALPVIEEAQVTYLLSKILLPSDIPYVPYAGDTSFTEDVDDGNTSESGTSDTDAGSDAFEGFELEDFFDLSDSEVVE